MGHRLDSFLRIAFIITRSSKLTREWYRGTMLYANRNPKWFVRVFEIGYGKDAEDFDLCGIHPDGIIACGVPVRFLKGYFHKRGMDDIPMMAFPQGPYPGAGTVWCDCEGIARQAIDLFRRRGCLHIAYLGGHLPNGVRLSRAFAKTFKAESARVGMPCTIYPRKIYPSLGIRVSEANEIEKWLADAPKPLGILTYDDCIGRDILDLCRLQELTVPGAVFVLGMDDNMLVCENCNPTMSSIRLDYEGASFEAAKALDDMIAGRITELPRLVCGVKCITERASTQDPKGAGRLVALACDYIAKNACRLGGIDQYDIARYLGVSVRTLQLRFKDAAFAGTILGEIQRVQLENVCKLLKTTDRSIADITFASGFRSLSRLKAVFVQKFGKSMRDYRNSAIPRKRQ